MAKVAAILGYEVSAKAPQVAVVRCNGSCANRPRVNDYDGAPSCKVKAALYSGDTLCPYGCLGCGDCVAACKFGALSPDPESGLPVVDESKCTACGSCVKSCPKGIIELRNAGTTPKNTRRVYVSCMNKDKGGVARKACKAACIGCGKCVKVCKFGAITVENNLSYIDRRDSRSRIHTQEGGGEAGSGSCPCGRRSRRETCGSSRSRTESYVQQSEQGGRQCVK